MKAKLSYLSAVTGMYDFQTAQVDMYESVISYISIRQICLTNELLFNALMVIILRPRFSLNESVNHDEKLNTRKIRRYVMLGYN